MGFSIELDEDDSDPELDGELPGSITIGPFEGSFTSSVRFWTADQYRTQWYEAVTRVVRDEKDSCLITSIEDPRQATMLFWWPMYRDGDIVHIQHAICFLDQLSVPFDVDKPHASMLPREQIDEDGEIVSEWDIHVDDLEDFLRASAGLRW